MFKWAVHPLRFQINQYTKQDVNLISYIVMEIYFNYDCYSNFTNYIFYRYNTIIVYLYIMSKSYLFYTVSGLKDLGC